MIDDDLIFTVTIAPTNGSLRSFESLVDDPDAARLFITCPYALRVCAVSIKFEIAMSNA